MSITRREFRGAADIQKMAALARAFPDDCLHVMDLPYRFASWALDDLGNTGLWVDAQERLLAWAIMQTPFWTIDYACHPDTKPDLHQQVLAWADRRARDIQNTPYGHPQWFVCLFNGQPGRVRDLEALGFTCQSDVGDDSWSRVLLRRKAQTPLPGDAVPPGYTIRPLAGAIEIEDYVELHRAVFESRSMTAAWRARTLRQPAYIPDLDLVAAGPDGRLAAFCICWLHRDVEGHASGQVEPLGVHAGARQLGLGRAILAEGLRRLQRRGAHYVDVETDNDRHAALELYQAVGFRAVRDILVYRKDYVPCGI